MSPPSVLSGRGKCPKWWVLAGVLFCVGVQSLLMADKLEAAPAASATPLANELSIKEISKERRARQDQFAFVIENGVSLAPAEVSHHFAFDLITFLPRSENLQGQFIAGMSDLV